MHAAFTGAAGVPKSEKKPRERSIASTSSFDVHPAEPAKPAEPALGQGFFRRQWPKACMIDDSSLALLLI